MKFAPKTKEEAMKSGLLEKGNYPFEVKAASPKISKAGNDMIEIFLKVWDKSGKEHFLYDYLMESVDYKLRHFCYSIGMGEMSEKGEFDCESIKGKAGICKIFIKEDKNGEYPPKNSIADYIEGNGEIVISPKEHNANEFDDDSIPF